MGANFPAWKEEYARLEEEYSDLLIPLNPAEDNEGLIVAYNAGIKAVLGRLAAEKVGHE